MLILSSLYFRYIINFAKVKRFKILLSPNLIFSFSLVLGYILYMYNNSYLSVYYLLPEDFILEPVMSGDEMESEPRGEGSVREVRMPLGLYHDRLHNVYIAAGTLGAAIAIVGVVVSTLGPVLNERIVTWLELTRFECLYVGL